MQPRAVLLVVLLLVLVAVSGFWLWGRLLSSAAPVVAAGATATPGATPSAAPGGAATPSPVPRPAGYRLAGVAVGEPDSFAVIEAPDGATGLYRLNQDVPALGELVRIEAERVVIRGSGGEFDLWLAPAATATPAPARTAKPYSATTRRQSRARTAGTTPVPEP